MGKIGQPEGATGPWGKKRGSLPRRRQREELVRRYQLEATGALPEPAVGAYRRDEESHEELQAALNEALDKVANESVALRIAHAEEVSTMREENRLLKEEIEKMHENVKDVRDELVLLKRLVAQGVRTNPHPTLTIPTARVEIPKPSAFKGARSAREKNFHSPKEDRRGERPVLKCYLCNGPHKARDCPKTLTMDREP
ncbi:hypothetical protein GH714_034033 [Hevea brasiliensis]|uniref:CCHC-type domain-containing protein n=1 Tax=Hevea brasiliensis TaxID=3981 RepID=A0A6A6L572_HEVBR|nr:hypothetical protein GH714_034033 [Hevea brasiliensis]